MNAREVIAQAIERFDRARRGEAVSDLGKLHRPRVYRYRVADTGFRAMLNRYPGCIIGAGLVVGHYAYCIKWGAAHFHQDHPGYVRGHK